MSRKLICLISFVVLFGLVANVMAADPNPIAWYKFDEGSGTAVADSSANGYNGTVTGAGWVAGKFGNALSFDGVSNAVTVGSTYGLGNTNVTISCWVNLDSLSEKGAFVKIGGSSDGYAIGVGGTSMDNAGNNLIIVYDGVGTVATHSKILTGWRHVAMVIDSSGRPSVYLDGRYRGTYNNLYTSLLFPGAPISPTGITYIGGYGSRYIDAMIDDVRIFNTALSAAEISAIYNSTRRCLDGVWTFTPSGGSTTTCPVPESWDGSPGFGSPCGGGITPPCGTETVNQAMYQTTVYVPSDWNGKRVVLEFGSVNYIADVYVNSTLITTHIGGYMPFTVDVTNYVTAGSSFTLNVNVKGGSYTPIVSTYNGNNPVWPVGWYGHEQNWGIVYPVWMKALGTVYAQYVHIKPSYRNGQLAVDYTLMNTGGSAQTVTASAIVVPRGGGSTVKSLGPSSGVSVPAGGTSTVSLTVAWSDPTYWFPNNPYLYELISTIMQGSTVIDTQTDRFGFRESYVSGTNFMLNGVIAHYRGSTLSTQYDQQFSSNRPRELWFGAWDRCIDKLFSNNMNIASFEPEMEDNCIVADETGFMTVEESPMLGLTLLKNGSGWPTTYINNSVALIPPWVKYKWNHPSIMMWSAENEQNAVGNMTLAQCLQLGTAIRNYDTTIPIKYEGDADAGDTWAMSTYDYHYPEGYLSRPPSGNIYQWADKIRTDKPSTMGEYLIPNTYADNRWWQGTWTRGCRYNGFGHLAPYTLAWSFLDPQIPTYPGQLANLIPSLAPVALFDKNYDNLGIGAVPGFVTDSYYTAGYPSVAAGATRYGNLLLYNDEFINTSIDIQADIKSGSTTYATGSRNYTVTLGSYIVIPYSFQVPYVGGSAMKLVLTTSKSGVQKFTETKNFNVTGASSGSSSSIVTLWNNLTWDDFETSFGSWTSGGTNCTRNTGSATLANSGKCSVRLAGSGATSILTHTNGIDISTPNCNKVAVSFWYRTASCSGTDQFYIWFYDGTTWQKVATYIYTTNFANTTWYNPTVVINKSSYTFPTNMKIKFESAFSATSHYVYIDEVMVAATGDAPGPASNPNPANLAAGVDVNANLSWTAGSGATSHDVYFGTNPAPGAGEFKGSQGGLTYDPGTLVYGTTYYWRIDEKNAFGTTTGSTWSFTTQLCKGDGDSDGYVTLDDLYAVLGLIVPTAPYYYIDNTNPGYKLVYDVDPVGAPDGYISLDDLFAILQHLVDNGGGDYVAPCMP